MKKSILWDLDGTLTNPKIGIVACIQYALASAGRAVPDGDKLLWCIGPPLHQSFLQLAPGASDAEAWKLVEFYRKRFAEVGLFENEIYPGITELLAVLHQKQNYVATSKPHIFASKIISHFDLTSYFVKVYGSELDGLRSDKAELIQYILACESIDKGEVLMIGDRKYDILGAKKSGICSVGITWGYGSRTELETAGADYIFDEPHELQKFLLSASS